jgi:hypothetical protein
MEMRRALLLERYRHPNITITAKTEGFADGLAEYFKSQVANGTRFKAGETVQLGWGVLRLVGDDDGELVVTEPDFHSMPIQWIDGAQQTMRQLTLQRHVCSLLDVEPDFTSLLTSGVASPNFMTGSDFSMSRDERGWWFRALEDDGTQAERHSLYVVALRRPAVIPFIALPPGAEILWAQSGVDILLAGKRLYSEAEQLLRDIVASPAFY